MGSTLTNFNCLRSFELTLDESVLVFSIKVGHSKFWRVKRNIGVALVETGLDANLKKIKKPSLYLKFI